MIDGDNWVARCKFFKVDDGVFIHGISLWDSQSVNQVPEGSRVHVCYQLSRLQEPRDLLVVVLFEWQAKPTDIDQRLDDENRAVAVLN